MKTIHKILITLGLVLLCFAGCESDLTGVKETELQKSSNDILLQSDGQMYYEQTIMLPATGDAVTISFDGFTNADTTDYIALVVITADGVGTIDVLNGGDYINGSYNKSVINQWQNITIRAVLWSDEINILSNATLKLTDIQVK